MNDKRKNNQIIVQGVAEFLCKLMSISLKSHLENMIFALIYENF